MRTDRFVAAALLVLAAGLVGLLVFGPVERTGAAAEPVLPVPTESDASVTEDEPEPVTTQPETEPAEPPPSPQVPAGAIRIPLSSQEVRFVPQPFRRKAWSATIAASAIAVQGSPGDQYGLECSVPHWAYVLMIDPWSGIYVIELEQRPVGSITELDRGEAPGLRSPPRVNRLRATCSAGPDEPVRLILVANGRQLAALRYDSPPAQHTPFNGVGLQAWSGAAGGAEIAFYDVVVRAG